MCAASSPLLALLLLPALVPAPARAADPPTLGSAQHLAPIGAGWGEVEPARISNGGDPAGEVDRLRWERWGHGKARGYGVTWLLRPEGGYYARPGRIVLRASRLGTCPDGTVAYTRLDVRVAPRPGEPAARRWHRWGSGGDLCARGLD
ncbi:hypothetical protein G5V58_20585 [Nocardioides anomalus]|uniref:Uncharacterized protein n=1 Tax=Nocardioides anomalus TaxID=2712223 RepID=A0A6G6WI67_9ACTN|nr:hypothetical protein [Nocardioides anomalus]QIG44857.1 hypothetical protein G5V58_20585 [Nocardioides anomalus]